MWHAEIQSVVSVDSVAGIAVLVVPEGRRAFVKTACKGTMTVLGTAGAPSAAAARANPSRWVVPDIASWPG